MNIKKEIKNFVEVYKASVRVAKEQRMVFPCDTILGVPIYHYDDLVKSKGMAFALVDLNNNIWVDDKFMSLPRNLQEVLVAHEVGHIVNKHTEGNKLEIAMKNFKRSLFSKRTVDQREIEADKHAVDILGKEVVIETLTKMKEMTKDICSNTYELDSRISIIKGM